MTLHHELVTADDARPVKWMLVAHGIFGSGKNWLPIARQVVARRPEWGIALVDLREHGRSTHMTGPMTLDQCAADLADFAHRASLHVEAVMGHSFGGKVMLTFARRRPPGLRTVFIVDSSVDSIPEPRGDGWMMMQLLKRLPQQFVSRDEAIGAMTSFGVSTPVAQWMVMNLERRHDHFAWRMNLDHIESLLRDYYRSSFWDELAAPPPGLRIHIIKASGSDHIPPEQCQRLDHIAHATGQIELHRLQGGHWLNVDNPAGMIELLANRLP
jgi:pimeloyl-ACP methyl ester carboxylesterase